MKKLVTILLIIVIVLLSVGCVQRSIVNNSRNYSDNVDIIRYDTNKDNEINPTEINTEDFENQLKNFYDFSQKFFPILDNHIEVTAQLLKKFNDENLTLDNKIIYSRMLREKYENFGDELKKINPPSKAYKAYQYILNVVSKRILFFREFEKGTSIKTLIEIEDEAYSYEVLFWDEINKVYNYYLGEIDKKNNMWI